MTQINRQQLIIDYMMSKHNLSRGFTTREIANHYGVTTNAILKGLKRLRTQGRVFQGWVFTGDSGVWYLSSSEIAKHRQVHA